MRSRTSQHHIDARETGYARRSILFALGLISIVAMAVACVPKAPLEDPFALKRDQKIDQCLVAIDEALGLYEVEEADLVYQNARARVMELIDNPYASRIVPLYRYRLIKAAHRIAAAKKVVRDMPRVVFYRGFDNKLIDIPKRRFAMGDLQGILQTLPAHRRTQINGLVAYYADRGAGKYKRYLRRLANYRNHISSVFKAYGLPEEMACVAMIESAVIPTQVSPAGAAGLWQFIPETARRYGLVVNEVVDQRFDPFLQTYAAAAYLRDLLEKFGGRFEEALAGYNCGENYVADLMADSDVHSLWQIARRGEPGVQGYTLPRETYDYVAHFFAVALIYQNMRRYGFFMPPAKDDPFWLVEIDGGIELSDFSNDLDLDPSVIAVMNPSLVFGRTLDAARTKVRLPAGPIDEYIDAMRDAGRYRLSCIYRHKITDYQSPRAIADDYGVSLARIVAFNDLRLGLRLPKGVMIEIPARLGGAKAKDASTRNIAWWKARNKE